MRLRTLVCLFFGAVLSGQTPLAFEVASIKPSNAGPGHSGWHTSQGLIRLDNQSLRALISIAYDVSNSQVAAGPKWTETDGFDITGKPPSAANDAQFRLMLRSLLAERFQLKFHREPRLLPGYALVVAKGGPKMKASESDSSSSHGERGKYTAKGIGMTKFAEALTRRLNAPVIDATALKSAFDLTLEWDESKDAPTGPSIFTAVQEQLGLKLEARKITLDTIVVDSAEKPSGN